MMMWRPKNKLMRRGGILICCCIFRILVAFCGMDDVEFMFWIRMSDDGVEVKAYSQEEMRNLNTFYCLCTGIFRWYSTRWLMTT